MNILIINWRDITHPWAGGAERHIHELSKQFIRIGNRVTLLCGGFKGAKKKEQIDGINIIRVGNTYSIFLYAPIYYLFGLRAKKYDLIIEVSHGLPFFTPLFCRAPKTLIVHHNHKTLWKTEFPQIWRAGSFIEDKITPIIYKNIVTVTLSESTKEQLERMEFKKIYAILPGIRPVKPKFKKNATPLILYLGRLRKYKRVDLLLRIYQRMKVKVSNLELIIAGDGQDRQRLKNLVEKMDLRGILFKGFVTEDEKIRLLQKSWVLAFPSSIEGWGLVVLEAAACGTPTVGFRVSGVSEAIKHGKSGFLADSEDEFEQKLFKILKNKNLRDKLSKGALGWVKNFSWEKSCRSFMEAISRDENN